MRKVHLEGGDPHPHLSLGLSSLHPQDTLYDKPVDVRQYGPGDVSHSSTVSKAKGGIVGSSFHSQLVKTQEN